MEYGYQNYCLKQLEKYKKSILIWFRQSGKTRTITEYLIEYVSKNTKKQILVITPKQVSSDIIHTNVWKELNLRINTLGNLPLSKESQTSNINGNVIYFKSKNYESLIRNSDVVIVEEFEYIKDLHIFLNYFNKKTKFIFTSSQFQTEAVTYIDREGDCYLSVISHSAVATNEEINQRIMQIGDKGAYNYEHEYGNIEELYRGLGIKKDRNLIDVWGVKIQRKKKLEEISKKIREQNDD